MDEYVREELDIIFNYRYNKSIKELRDCYIYYSSLGEDNIENYERAKQVKKCLEDVEYEGFSESV